jgi:hypothetical protein
MDSLRMELSNLSSDHTNQMLVQNSLIHKHQQTVEVRRQHQQANEAPDFEVDRVAAPARLEQAKSRRQGEGRGRQEKRE